MHLEWESTNQMSGLWYIMMRLNLWKATIRKQGELVVMDSKASVYCFTHLMISLSLKNSIRTNQSPKEKMPSCSLRKSLLTLSLPFAEENSCFIILERSIWIQIALNRGCATIVRTRRKFLKEKTSYRK